MLKLRKKLKSNGEKNQQSISKNYQDFKKTKSICENYR